MNTYLLRLIEAARAQRKACEYTYALESVRSPIEVIEEALEAENDAILATNEAIKMFDDSFGETT